MSDVETRLRDALAARATTVQGDPGAYAAVVRRRERRGVRRVVAVGVAAASVAAIAVTVAVARPVPDPAPPASPAPVAPAPAVFTALIDGKAALFHSDGYDRFRSAVPVGYRTTSVAAYGDGRRFVSAALKGCTTTFTHFEITKDLPNHRSTFSDAVPGGDIAGRVMQMAVSPDGTRLAYALRLPLADGRCGNAGQIRVRDLRTGKEQSWDDGRPVTSETDPFYLSSLTWSADGRRLSLGERISDLDTTLPGAKVEYLQYENHDVPGYELCAIDDRLFRGATGRTVLLLRCMKDLDAKGSMQNIAFDYDPVTGRVGEQLFALPLRRGQMDPWFLSFDRSGDHAFLKVLDATGGTKRVYRWDRGAGVREVDLRGKDVEQIAW